MSLFDFFKNLIFGKKTNHHFKIIPVSVHGLKSSMIDFNALKIIKRLKNYGYEGYVVGGALRDFLLGKKPKDYDVVTSAKPKDIRRLFTNSRIIGKRFKLVHILFRDAIIETATFRSGDGHSGRHGLLVKDNQFGTIDEDAMRRDFGINALYYDPETENIIDYVNGYEDIKNRIINPLKDPAKSFREDPVRMLRAVKYSAVLNCSIEQHTAEKIRKMSPFLTKSSISRLHEEILKILKGGYSAKIFRALHDYQLLRFLIPFLADTFQSEDEKERILQQLETMDERLKSGKTSQIDLYWAVMIRSQIESQSFNYKEFAIQKILTDFISSFLTHLRVPNKVIDSITKSYILYKKMLDISYKNNIKRYSKNSHFKEARDLLNIFETDQNLIQMWNKVQISHFHVKNKKVRQSDRDHEPVKNARKMITTKNFNESKQPGV